jgi:hypothetical protein
VRPIRTAATTGVYRAPDGLEGEVGGLPYYRTSWNGIPAIHSTWEFTDAERRAIAAGAKLMVTILGEPIPPIALGIGEAEELHDDVPEAFRREEFEP